MSLNNDKKLESAIQVVNSTYEMQYASSLPVFSQLKEDISKIIDGMKNLWCIYR